MTIGQKPDSDAGEPEAPGELAEGHYSYIKATPLHTAVFYNSTVPPSGEYRRDLLG